MKEFNIEYLPKSICVRVTRHCNAGCHFCQAPYNRENLLSTENIFKILRWLKKNNVDSVKINGGEPSIRKDISEIIYYCRKLELQTTLCTNGISLSESLISTIKKTDTKVKISLHGNQELHDSLMRTSCYSTVVSRVQQFVDDNVFVSIQTMLSYKNKGIADYMIEFCLKEGIKKLSFIPFVPRGAGLINQESFELDENQRNDLKLLIKKRKIKHEHYLDIRYLDFWTKDYFVVESNGVLTIERFTDEADIQIKRIL